jgi:diguanylate cyclase (GGDEF)-like protein
MELLLWRWSTLVQATSDLMIAVFFLALARSLGRRELRAWVGAWLANFAALAVTIVFWLAQPQGAAQFGFNIAAYLFAKTLFVALLIYGTVAFAKASGDGAPYARLCAVVAAFAVLGGLLIHSIDALGLVQSAVIGVALGLCALYLVWNGGSRYAWLAAGFSLRALLGLAEAVAYGLQSQTADAQAPSLLATFLASHSSFDTGAEWVIALGCVLTLYDTIQRELTQSNGELRHTQEQLRDLLHRDQLTGVFNRRALPTMLREAQTGAGAILFFDLDGFKQVNDLHGHHVGDACLVRFARALQENFSAGDRVLRYAGDEFVVITQDHDADAIAARIEAVRRQLADDAGTGPRIGFSVGSARLTAQSDPDAALRQADQSMYEAKAMRQQAPT